MAKSIIGGVLANLSCEAEHVYEVGRLSRICHLNAQAAL